MHSILVSSLAVLFTQATDIFTTPSVPYCLFASSKEPCTFSQIFLGNVMCLFFRNDVALT
jgi:hypothetical protein